MIYKPGLITLFDTKWPKLSRSSSDTSLLAKEALMLQMIAGHSI